MTKNSTPSSRGRAMSVVERLDPRLLLAADAAALQARGFVPMEWQGNSVHAKAGEWILGLDNVAGTAGEQIAAAGKKLGKLGFTVTRHLGGDGVLLVESNEKSLPAGIQNQIRKLPGVRYLQPNFALSLNQTPNDPDYQGGKLWGLNNANDADIDAPEAWDLATGDRSAVVAVIDSGVDYNHPDLRDNMWVNPFDVAGDGLDNDGNGYIDDLHGANLITGSGNPMDDQGHGTHVAGTIAGVGNNGGGIVGVNWDASVMALKFLDSAGYGSSADAIEALHYAINMKTKGVNVVATNNSYGGEPWSRAFYDAISASADPNNDGSPSDAILFVAASGNGDWRGRALNNDSTPHYPSSYGHNGRTFDDPATAVIEKLPSLDSVIAVTATDNKDAKASFGNYGSASVDLGAPGVNIWSAAIGGGYKYNNGTSMAAPHVAGAVALASAYNPGATAPEIKAAILGGVDIRSGLSKTSTGGRLNLYNTLVNLPVKAAPTAPQNLAAAAVSSYEITVTWGDASGETHYVLQRYTTDAAGVKAYQDPVELAQNVTRYDDTGLAAGTTYFYTIKAVNSVGGTASPVDASATTPVLDVPAAPEGLTATTAGASQIDLEWTDTSDDELGFRIERRIGATGEWQQVASTGAGMTSYQDIGLASGTTYYYQVFAFNHSTVSAASNEASATTIGAAPVGNGTGLRGEYFDIDTREAAANWWSDNPNNSKDNLKHTRTDATVDFNWGTAKPVSQLLDGDTFAVRWSGLIQPRYTEAYTFYIGPLDDGVGLWVNGEKLINPTTWERDGGNSLSNTSPVTSNNILLEAGQKYTIELRYYDWTGGANISLQWRSPSQAQQVVPTTQLYQGPSDLAAANDGSGRIKLTWTDNASSETGFKIERSTNGKKWTQIATVGSNTTDAASFVDTGLTDTMTYQYRVRSYNDALNFDSSYTRIATAQAGAADTATTSGTTGTAAGLVDGLAERDELFSSALIAAM